MSVRGLSRKELEELRKKEEEEAAATVFKEFVETFQEAPSTTSKVWVKAGTYDAGARKEDTSERGKIYKPVPRVEELKKTSTEDVIRSLASKPEPRHKSKNARDKKKSNLELFKEELQKMQEERSERHKYKTILKERTTAGPDTTLDSMIDVGSYDTGDPNTTNLYLGNLNPKITEQQLMEIFGRFGPLASIKIMWPRSDEEKARGRNCGFVAFMSRKDSERALKNLNGKEVMNYEMKLGWGKALVIPPVPVYIPPALQLPSRPPPPSGLPFNAQPPRHLTNKIPRVRLGEFYPSNEEDKATYEKILSQSIVKVVIPTERNILMLIHRMVEFVIREGPMFEAIIMSKELNNPYFRFLFENQSPAHVYYRWKLFSMLQGDSPKQWSLKDFRMFKDGSVWRPPPMNLYTAGMPDDLVEEEEARDTLRGSLSTSQRDRLEQTLRAVSPSRASVGAAMAWCVEHAEAAGEVARCVAEALCGPSTPPRRRLARLYLLSDVLHNSAAKRANASAYRAAFQQHLEEIMRSLHAAWQRLSSRLQREGFRARVTRVLHAWHDWQLYPPDALAALNAIFLGIDQEAAREGADTEAAGGAEAGAASPSSESGGSSSGPLDGAALRRLAAAPAALSPLRPAMEDIDGVPVEEDIDGVPLESEAPSGVVAAGFVPSRWETVDPAGEVGVGGAEVGGAETPPSPPPPPSPPALRDPATPDHAPSHDGSAGDETQLERETLRAIEMRVLRYADELEAGARPRRANLDHQHVIQHYRRKLIRKALREARAAAASPEPRDDDLRSNTSKKSKKSRERTVSPPLKRSRHSDRRSRSRSREKERDRDMERPRERERDRSRERRRRSPATPPASHHRKHSKHAKYKY